MPTKGEAKFTNQLGIKGVNLKKSMYQKRLFLFLETMRLNLPNSLGNFLKTKCLASVKLIMKHREAPKHEH